MITLSALGGTALVGIVIATLILRRRRANLLATPNDIVFMEEDVLSDFLTAEYERNVALSLAARPSPPPEPAAQSSASQGSASQGSEGVRKAAKAHMVRPEETLENGERVIPSMSGGVTAVAGPPTDLADEGWARDPGGRHEWRYFDLEGWSDFVLDGENVDTDPISVVA